MRLGGITFSYSDIAALKLPLPKSEIAGFDWWESDWKTLPRERTILQTVAARDFNIQFTGEPANLTRVLAEHGWLEAGSANWRWGLLSMNPAPTEFTLPPLKRDYLGHADILLLHRLGGDPFTQETIRLWDSGFRLNPGGKTVYLGQLNGELLVERMKFFSYWQAQPVSKETLDYLEQELGGLQIKRVADGLLLIRDPQASAGS